MCGCSCVGADAASSLAGMLTYVEGVLTREVDCDGWGGASGWMVEGREWNGFAVLINAGCAHTKRLQERSSRVCLFQQ